jgi:hypothetical protein
VSDIVVLCEQGDLRVPGSKGNMLLRGWAAVKKCLHYQPLEHIKEYVLCMAWILQVNADTSFSCWIDLFHLVLVYTMRISQGN